MDFCGLSEEFLEDAKRYGTYDPDMPFQFRREFDCSEIRELLNEYM